MRTVFSNACEIEQEKILVLPCTVWDRLHAVLCAGAKI